ncbi:uncharacterized protein C8R40DRAFT_1067203 [Lentinula edodes]|uniref:uncharacterized protein n=1 Tax=Lentinula edodes TaxID=5353 RepID=UPI001E8D089E|nr:uncharacterized protein C8R40DRAFT_1067203 [Lentinula edodes]KAH7878156.1 hypothetical protein C8R40DRAFT_1067203 [Lentinula edodes]
MSGISYDIECSVVVMVPVLSDDAGSKEILSEDAQAGSNSTDNSPLPASIARVSNLQLWKNDDQLGLFGVHTQGAELVNGNIGFPRYEQCVVQQVYERVRLLLLDCVQFGVWCRPWGGVYFYQWSVEETTSNDYNLENIIGITWPELLAHYHVHIYYLHVVIYVYTSLFIPLGIPVHTVPFILMATKAADANALVHASRSDYLDFIRCDDSLQSQSDVSITSTTSTTSMYTFFLFLPLGFRFVPMEALSDATI